MLAFEAQSGGDCKLLPWAGTLFDAHRFVKAACPMFWHKCVQFSHSAVDLWCPLGVVYVICVFLY